MVKPFSVIHLSDLHFGRIHSNILLDLEIFIKSRKDEISLAILTGDFTQRARTQEFKDARDFIHSLNCPLFIVPGNHDVPLYNPFLRFLSPYKKFLRYLGPFAQKYYEDERFAVFGLWTVDNYSVQTGKIYLKDLNALEDKFKNVPQHKIKIIASHHPLASMNHKNKQVDLDRVLKLNPHFFMWGHEHISNIRRYVDEREFPVIMASGTSTSSRTREEANSFNYMTFEESKIRIQIFRHSDQSSSFEPICETIIPHNDNRECL